MRTQWIALAFATLAFGFSAPAQRDSFGSLRTMMPTDNDNGHLVLLGDVDGDGDLDVFVGNFNQDRVLRNEGRGVFRELAGAIPAGEGGSYFAAFSDSDSDGDLDLFVLRQVGIELLANDGQGNFTTQSFLTGGFSSYWRIYPADFDDDNDDDLLILHDKGTQLFRNDGNNVFVDVSSHLPLPAPSAREAAVADFDGDNDLDILVPSALWLNNGNAVFTPSAFPIPIFSGGIQALEHGDFDGDGDQDVVVGIRFVPDRILLNDGAGQFTDTAGLPPLLERPLQYVAVDMDNDTDLDLFVSNELGNPGPVVRYFENDGSGVFSAAATPVASEHIFYRRFDVGDVDGDNDPDVVLAGSTERNRLYLNDGQGNLRDSNVQPIHNADVDAIALGDIDGDGDLDAAISEELDDRLWINDGAGIFTDASQNLALRSAATRDVAFADVDGDGDLDLIQARYDEQTTLQLNDGNGVFTDASAQLPVETDLNIHVVAGDVDGDQDVDLIIGTWGPIKVYINDGTGTFSNLAGAVAPPPLGGHVSSELLLVDVDGDSDLDLFVSTPQAPRSPLSPNRLHLNDGTGVFTEVAFDPVAERSNSADFGDVDGDNDPDLVIGNSGQSRLYLNDGAGNFADQTAQLSVGVKNTGVIRLLDADGDGDLDVFMGNVMEPHALLLNDGTGNFQDNSSTLPTDIVSTYSAAIGDLDYDGDDDLVLGGDDLRVFTNLTLQISAFGLPRYGKPMAVPLNGPPGAPWVMFLATGPANIPFPPLGRILVDPTILVVAATGVLDANGEASPSALVPLGGPPGLTLYNQALVATPALRLTNREPLTFTNF